MQGSAEEDSVLCCSLFGFNVLKGFLGCRAEGQSLPSSLCCKFAVPSVLIRTDIVMMGVLF